MPELTMERRIARNFYNKAKQLISEDGEREQLFNILRAYQQDLDLTRLLNDLRRIINQPSKMELFDEIRPLVPLKHQLEYDVLAPPVPSEKLRVIRLCRRTNESLGFAVRGGLEHGVGIFVSEVDPECQAYHLGLRVGDEIVRVNGFTIDQAIHEEALNLIKAKQEIVLKVRNVGMIPVREKMGDAVTWKYTDRDDQSNHTVSWQITEKSNQRYKPGRLVKLYVNLRGVAGLGCSICSGPVQFPGVFIQSIKVGSLAEEAGLDVGDQLVDVNGTSFHNVTHSEAVLALRASSELYISLRKGVGLKLFKIDDEPISAQQALEAEKLFQLRENNVERNREQLKGEDKERSILEDEQERREAKKRKEDEEFEALRLKHERELREEELSKEREAKAVREEEERRIYQAEERRRREQEDARSKQEEEARRKMEMLERLQREEEEKRRQAELRERQQQMKEEAARELRDLKDREKRELAKKRDEERQEKKRKRLEKEQLHLQKVGELSREKSRKEHQLRLQRHQQDHEEMMREEMRTGCQPSGLRLWRPIDSTYMPSTSPDIPGSDMSEVEEDYFHHFMDTDLETVPDIRVTSPSSYSPLSSSSDPHRLPLPAGPAFHHRPLEIEAASLGISYSSKKFDPKKLFNPLEIGGRQINLVRMKRDGPLDVEIEGGMGTPLGGKIIISEVFYGGSVHKQGGIHKGDQLMMVDGVRLMDVTLAEGQSILDNVANKLGDFIEIIVAKSPPKEYEDEVFFTSPS